MNEYADTLAQSIIDESDGNQDQATILALVIGNLAQYLADHIDA